MLLYKFRMVFEQKKSNSFYNLISHNATINVEYTIKYTYVKFLGYKVGIIKSLHRSDTAWQATSNCNLTFFFYNKKYTKNLQNT